MLPERYVRAHPDDVRAALRRRHASDDMLHALDAWLRVDSQRRETASHFDRLSRTAHARAGNTGKARTARKNQEQAAATLNALETEARHVLLRLPNLPDERVPDGDGPRHNVELRRWGEPPPISFPARQHDEIGKALGILDLARATRLSGPRFPLLVGAGARLARALACFMLDQHARAGYTEIAPPHLLRRESMEGSAHLPHFEGEMYAVEGRELFLSPTAEAQLVALHAGETLVSADLPLAYTACTPAFRREAGSANASSRGLIRQHQFDKVELVRITQPEMADVAFDAILTEAEAVLQALALPYRVVALCAGDLPFSARRTYDIEVWMAGQQRWLEISSISDCGTFQARRLRLRYQEGSRGRTQFVATLNGSALPIGRTLAALLENGQQSDGSVTLPGALRPYFAAERLMPTE